MPPKILYKTLPILLKSRRLTVLLEAAPSKTIADLKQEALSALTSSVVNVNGELDVPEVHSIDDFEICREVKERRIPTGKFETLGGSILVKDTAVAYETLIIRFRENGRLMPAEYTAPPILADEDEPEPELSTSKGKRKALPE
ncbi:hypothetical protein EW145_g2449 [Phellinidium pouzarii]|uniref:Uncharacterized protein n=1 Tax=Phellinidium pouzarii TaxID=167371 RepID=A0A4V3XD92_9AGAM|nr:hypothetical protein EW145_g2449 [Phellinidium pouzarii]